MCNAVLEAFVNYLIDEKEIDLVAIYVAALPRSRQIDLYARLLKGLLICSLFSSKFCINERIRQTTLLDLREYDCLTFTL